VSNPSKDRTSNNNNTVATMKIVTITIALKIIVDPIVAQH
jgi:hypothetical protein